MTKKINPDESNQTESTAETIVSSDTEHEDKSHTFRNILFLIFFLLLVVGGSYYLTPLLLPYLSESSVIKQDEVISVEVSETETPVIVADDYSTVIQPEIAIEESNLPEESQAEMPLTPSGVVLMPEQPVPILPKPDTNTYNTPSVNIQSQPVTPKSAAQDTLLIKVIQLYEAFQQDGQCRPLLEKLITLSELHPVIQSSVNELLTICLENPISEQIQTAFYKNKKRAILRILQNKNTPMMAYVKALPYLIFDIRKKDAFDDTPMDTLYRLQAAVEGNDFSQILDLINQLPDNVQPVLYDLKQSAIHENTIYQVLQNLIQTLATGGNNE